MCGKYIQRIKIVINSNIIEQVTDFKYLGYCIAEYKSDLEDKLQLTNISIYQFQPFSVSSGPQTLGIF